MSSNKPTVNNSALKSVNNNLQKILQGIAAMKAPLKTPLPKKPSLPHEREVGLKEAYKEYRDDYMANFVYGLYHPDVVFHEHLDIKFPATMPIPTTTFAFKDTFTIAPNYSGNFVLVWNPNFLGSNFECVKPTTQDPANYNGVFSNVYYNVSGDLDGNSTIDSDWQCRTFKHVNQSFNKYRLTSACIKVKYTGKVLDQSGCLAACATYSTFPRTTAAIPRAQPLPAEYPYKGSGANAVLGRWGDFDTIRQGQWSHTVNVVSEPDGITCVYLPSDPLSEVFVNDGETIDSHHDQVVYDSGNAYAIWQPKNANLGYAICGYGIDTNASAITVECYYNFEIIVHDEQMPYFRPSVVDARLVRFGDRVNSAIKSISSSYGGVTKTKDHEAPSTMTRIKAALSTAWKYAGDIVPILLKVGKAIL